MSVLNASTCTFREHRMDDVILRQDQFLLSASLGVNKVNDVKFRNFDGRWNFYYAQAWDVEVAVVYQLVLPRVILHVCIYDACMYV